MNMFLKSVTPVLVSSLLLLVSSFQITNAATELDGVAVVVNNDVITLRELENRVHDYAIQLRVDTSNVQDMAALKKQVMERMIENQIQLQMADKLGIKIDDVGLNRVLVSLAESNKLTLDQMRDRIAAEGLDFTRFREQTREELIIKQLQQREVADKVTVSEQEIKQYITNNSDNTKNLRYHIRHILIATPQNAKPDDITEAQKKADQIYQALQKGEKFSDAAMKNSSGRYALKGGDLGWHTASELPVAFVDALRDMKSGEISRPIRSASGFHIIQLVGSSNSAQVVEQNHSRHILIRTSPELDDDGARELLSKLRTEIKNGADFAKLAKKYSQDPGSKNKGGDLGWASPGAYVQSFESVIESLKPGEISEPFRSQYGWHIVQLIARREHKQTSETLEAQARNEVRKRKIDEELRLWLRRIRDEAYVQIIDPHLAPSTTPSDG
jgi:peptidyl-prolyl cis-trans isomerase SurA